LRNFPKKFSFPKNPFFLPPMFDRVSSDTLNYGGHTVCPVSASRYTVAALRSGRGRQFGCLLRCATKTESDLSSKASWPESGDLIVMANVCW
jgi:hypothetical protein